MASKRLLAFVCAVLLCVAVLAMAWFVFLCAQAWCPSFSWARGRLVQDFFSCRDQGFPVVQTHPPQCRAGQRVFYSGTGSRMRIAEPIDGQRVGLPMMIAGDVRVGSGTLLQFRLLDRDGFTLVEDHIAIPKALSGQVVPFRTSVTYPRPMGITGSLIVALPQRKAVAEQVDIPVTFAPVASVEVKAFFGNRERDPQGVACDVSYPVARRVPIGADLPSAALRELLRGTTLTEQRQLFKTSIPKGVSVRSLRVERSGRASVVFSPELTQEAQGACRMAAIRSQIERTLMQFPNVTDVEIAVEGTASGQVLQP